MSTIKFVIYGEPASKANSRKVVKHFKTGKSMLIKSAKALRYEKDFKVQCRRLNNMMEGTLGVNITIYYRSNRPDLDESVILDCMQGYIYANDRQVREKHVYWGGTDKANPRSEIEVFNVEPR